MAGLSWTVLLHMASAGVPCGSFHWELSWGLSIQDGITHMLELQQGGLELLRLAGSLSSHTESQRIRMEAARPLEGEARHTTGIVSPVVHSIGANPRPTMTEGEQ